MCQLFEPQPSCPSNSVMFSNALQSHETELYIEKAEFTYKLYVHHSHKIRHLLLTLIFGPSVNGFQYFRKKIVQSILDMYCSPTLKGSHLICFGKVYLENLTEKSGI